MATHLNITVVEDHEALRVATVEVLRQQGYQACGLDSASPLEASAAEFAANIFIVDRELLTEDGLSLVHRIRSLRPEAGIIMTGGLLSAENRNAVFESGADVYLTKPVMPEELIAAVGAVQRQLKG
jgi:DNA-binding response OmpR family regulator